MNVVEIFAGSRSFGKVAKRLGCNVFSVDLKPFEGIDLAIDFEEMTVDMIPFKPDVIIFGIPCTSYSLAAISHHRNEDRSAKTEFAAKSDRMAIKMVEFINHFGCTYFIENPRATLRKMPFMLNLPRTTVTYCSYGDTRMKPTDIWSNDLYDIFNQDGWRGKPMCFNNNRKCQHESSPRGSRTGTQGLKNNYERSIVPPKLCESIIKHCIRKHEQNHTQKNNNNFSRTG